MYDIWQTCKQDVRDVYRFKETYVDTTNYTRVLKEYLVDKRYDIAVGAFSMLYERSRYVRFTRPFVLNRHVVVHKPSLHWTSTLPSRFVYSFLPLLCVFLLLGAVMYTRNTPTALNICSRLRSMTPSRHFTAKTLVTPALDEQPRSLGWTQLCLWFIVTNHNYATR